MVTQCAVARLKHGVSDFFQIVRAAKQIVARSVDFSHRLDIERVKRVAVSGLLRRQVGFSIAAHRMKPRCVWIVGLKGVRPLDSVEPRRRVHSTCPARWVAGGRQDFVGGSRWGRCGAFGIEEHPEHRMPPPALKRPEGTAGTLRAGGGGRQHLEHDPVDARTLERLIGKHGPVLDVDWIRNGSRWRLGTFGKHKRVLVACVRLPPRRVSRHQVVV